MFCSDKGKRKEKAPRWGEGKGRKKKRGRDPGRGVKFKFAGAKDLLFKMKRHRAPLCMGREEGEGDRRAGTSTGERPSRRSGLQRVQFFLARKAGKKRKEKKNREIPRREGRRRPIVFTEEGGRGPAFFLGQDLCLCWGGGGERIIPPTAWPVGWEEKDKEASNHR